MKEVPITPISVRPSIFMFLIVVIVMSGIYNISMFREVSDLNEQIGITKEVNEKNIFKVQACEALLGEIGPSGRPFRTPCPCPSGDGGGGGSASRIEDAPQLNVTP